MIILAQNTYILWFIKKVILQWGICNSTKYNILVTHDSRQEVNEKPYKNN